MFRHQFAKQYPRRGSILLVVITFLALFAVIGLSFALYAESENSASRIHMEAFQINDLPGRANPDEPNATQVANLVLGQIIYGPVEDAVQGQSAFRGHDLARLMYSSAPALAGVLPLSPYSGRGVFLPGEIPAPETDADPIFGNVPIERFQVFNYALKPGHLTYDPELGLSRSAAPDPTLGRFPKPVNAAYTYPDAKDLMLAVIDTTTPGQIGRVLKASYQRPGESYALASDEYFSGIGRFQMLRPRPLDHLLGVMSAGDRATLQGVLTSGAAPAAKNAAIAQLAEQYQTFPYPPINADGTVTGDVQNLPYPGSQQHNDSFWMYPGGPIRQWNGKYYTAIVAPMIVDLNGRVNLSVAGNRKRPADSGHASGPGVGPWEINPKYVLRAFDPVTNTERIPDTGTPMQPDAAVSLLQVLSGSTFLTPGNPPQPSPGRYGIDAMTTLPSTVPPLDPFRNLPQAQFNGGRIPPFYSRVNVDGTSVLPPPAADRVNPIGVGSSPFPNFPASRYFDATTQPNQLANHPAQFNPEHKPDNSVTNTGGLFGFPVGVGNQLPLRDMLMLQTRIGGKMEGYSRATTARLTPRNLLSGNYTATTPFNPQNNTLGTPINPVRTTFTDGADLVRLLTTTHSSNLTRPELVVPAVNDASNMVATCRLPAIDMNRPLPDYRQDLNHMLAPDNFGNFIPAQVARQRFARDIFVRLAAIANLIDGVNTVYVNDPAQPDYGYIRFLTDPSTTPMPSPPYPATDKLTASRALAQIAANMVDFLDPDDVSTTFTFWPTQTIGPAGPGNAFIILPTGLPDIGAPGSSLVPADQIGNHAVFGTELPRVVLNEAFAELTNDPRDWHNRNNPGGPPVVAGMQPAQHNFEKRLFIELHNPMRTDLALSEDGRARLAYPANAFNGVGAFPQHQILVTDNRPNLIDNPANVTGSPWHPSADPSGAVVRSRVDNYTYDATDGVAEEPAQAQPIAGYGMPSLAGATAANLERYTIQTNDNPNGDGTVHRNLNGYAVLGPVQDFPGVDSVMNPALLNATIRIQPQAGAAQGSNPSPRPLPPHGLQFDTGTNDAMRLNPADAATVLNPVAVYLRRTAIPYLPPNDPLDPNYDPAQPLNPFLTVDRLENIPTANNVLYDNNDIRNPAPDKGLMQSIGRTHAFSCQLEAPQGAPMAMDPFPANTFFFRNTGLQPNSVWLKHLDRDLLNSLELANVSAVAPSELTRYFATPGAPVQWNTHSIESVLLPNTLHGVIGVPGLPLLNNPSLRGPLARALDFLTVRSIQSGVPIGGREHGRININTMWHPSVARALFDGNDVAGLQSGNAFLDTTVGGNDGVIDPANINGDVNFSFWGRMIGAGVVDPNLPFRTPSFPNVSPTDRPYRSVGNAPLTDTILRTVTDGVNPVPYTPFYNHNAPAMIYQDPTHVTLKTEPLGKAWNSMTTTSDQFLVIMTVSFVEVKPTSPGIFTAGAPVFLGRELFREVPGDLRSRFAAIVDRTNLGLDDSNFALQSPNRPWFTRLAADINPGDTQIQVEASPIPDPGNPMGLPIPHVLSSQQTVNSFGNATSVSLAHPLLDAGRPFLRVGFGERTLNQADGELLATTGAAPVSWNGSICTIQLPGPALQYHVAGSPVSNVLLGHPGPQPAFDMYGPRYRGTVVPLVIRFPRGQ